VKDQGEEYDNFANNLGFTLRYLMRDSQRGAVGLIRLGMLDKKSSTSSIKTLCQLSELDLAENGHGTRVTSCSKTDIFQTSRVGSTMTFKRIRMATNSELID